MLHRTHLAIAALAVLTTAFAGCGGTTFSSDASASRDGGASGGSAGSGTGGKPSTGGGSGTGGHASGGKPGSGGVPGAGGLPAAGGLPGAGGVPVAGGAPGAGGGFPASGGAPGSGGAGGTCDSSTCDTYYYTCCGNSCINTENDPQHCGACDIACPTDAPYCSGGLCGQPPCTPLPNAGICAPTSTCCGTTCCSPGQICCTVTANFTTIGCYDPAQTGGTCPRGCPLCVCASPDTPIATPDGERAIASLHAGDRVLSVDHGRVVEVPILEVHRNPAFNHHVVRVELASGAVLEISAPHPTADGRTFGDLHDGDRLGGVRIARVSVVPYAAAFTYDILPASDSGTYYAGGVLIGSTLGGTALSSGAPDYSATGLSPSR